MTIELRLTGGLHNTNVHLSLGGQISATQIVDNVNHNLFDEVSKLDIINEVTDTRCIGILNTGSASITNVQVELESVSDYTKILLALEDGIPLAVASEYEIAGV